MPNKPNSDLLNQSISSDLDENIRIFKRILHAPDNEDAIFREFSIYGIRICAVFIEGMANENKTAEFVLHAMKMEEPIGKPDHINMDWLNKSLFEVAQTRSITENSEAISSILAGMTCIFADGCEEALLLETRDFPHRSVEKPTSESVVGGPHEGFNEHLRTNISLVRRYVQSPELISQKLKVGTEIPTQVVLLYLDGVANEKCVQEIRRRLMCIQEPVVHSLGEIQQLIEDQPMALLPQMLETERPDRTAACIEDGQVAILVENAPTALIAPITFFHLIHASDDSYLRWQYGTALRIIRILGIVVSLLLPAVYVAIALHHTHLIPMSLLTSIAQSRASVPFPIVVEVLFMEFSFYLLNEAGLRTPSQIGSAFGIVGALVLGQAAVSASIISPILIIIISLTGLGNYVVPNFGFSIGMMIYRIGLLILSALLGLYGIIIGLFLILLQACSMKSFGVDYFAPIAPRRPHNPDLMLRLPVKLQKKIMYFAAHDSWLRKREAKSE